MKTILNLEGIKTLSKEEQTNINGSAFRRGSCYEKGGLCCESTDGPRGDFCDAGYCGTWGCVFY